MTFFRPVTHNLYSHPGIGGMENTGHHAVYGIDMIFNDKKNIIAHLAEILCLLLLVCFPEAADAAMTGQCSNCHTMHNNQGGNPMVTYTYGAETDDTKFFLLRGTCLGCHAMGTANRIESISGSEVPQVYHTDPAGDLAGGNFAYLLGVKGSGADDTKGHNIIDFGDPDDTFTQPPGRRHDIASFNGNFTCAGTRGCHGIRAGSVGADLRAIKGAHHGNTGNKMDTANTVYNSYRFLYGVKGLENNGQNDISTEWQNVNGTNHNEYFGDNTPMDFDITGCNSCHEGMSSYISPDNNTMSGFCATCHGYYHLLDGGGQVGVGDDNLSPFKRHPTDVILPGSGEYTSYASYNVNIPVARQTPVPDLISSTVTAGSDVVMCLSCHGAHATNYYKILKWDYKSTTLSTAISGCNVCHTSKN